jgi:predicted metalloprotease with PDZ domain
MRSLIQVAAAVGALFFCIGAAAPSRIDYTLTPRLENGALQAVQIDLTFRGDADGESDLRLPDAWGGQNELWRGVQELEIVSGAASLRPGEQPNQRVITHRPDARIHIRYRVVQDWDGVPRAELGNTYRATIQPTYFHLIGNAALVTPGGASLDAPVRLRARGLPRGWAFASDLQHRDLTLERAWSSVIVGGDFRILRDPRSNLRLAIRGEWSFTDRQLLDQASGILAAHRDFWGDPATPYLVTVLQLAGPEGALSVGGTGLDDAFAFFATPNAPQEVILRTLAHESFHTWISGQVGGLPQEDQASQYWLSEGFTDFYTARSLVRGGLWTPQQYADDLNEALTAYAQSPVRTAPNSRITADYWNDRDVQRLPYLRGRFLAMIWDARLRATGRSFDAVAYEMRRRARDGAEYAVEVFRAAAPAIGLDLGTDVETYVDDGVAIFLPEDLLAPCGRITTRDVPAFHRGFDIEATLANDSIIAGVDPALPAYAAGMRNGMILVRREAGEIGNAEMEIAYVVRDGDTERTLRYMPRGYGQYAVQRLELAPDLEGARLAQCLAAIGGEVGEHAD